MDSSIFGCSGSWVPGCLAVLGVYWVRAGIWGLNWTDSDTILLDHCKLFYSWKLEYI